MAAAVSLGTLVLVRTSNFTKARPSSILIDVTFPTTTPAIFTLSFGSRPVTSSNEAESE